MPTDVSPDEAEVGGTCNVCGGGLRYGERRRKCGEAAMEAEIERLRGIVPEALERLNDELCAENDRLRAALWKACGDDAEIAQAYLDAQG